MKKFLFIAPLAVVLAACTTTPQECDPNVELSIFNKAGCKLSGSYDKRIEQKEKILLDEQATNRQFREIYANIKAQQEASSKSVAAKQAQQKRLNQSLQALTANLKKKAAGKSKLQADIADVEKQLKNVNNSSSSELEKQAELERLKKKLSTLQSALGLIE